MQDPRTQIADTKNKTGETVEVFGWVNGRRDHGKIIFIDIRDRTGLVQVVFTPAQEKIYKIAEKLRNEWVIRVKGNIIERPKSMVNNEIETGKIEIQPSEIEVFAESETPPFDITTDGRDLGEENRMKFRYLDLRRQRMKNNLISRHKTVKFIRDYLDGRGFIEVETPILTKSTPEGARDYVVPSRLYPGKFFALPQSPQQYKQLLMVGGIEKYFQIARCFRDEDTRGDRQPEFTQLDLEMSFVDREDVMALNEDLLINIVKTLYPGKKIQETPFPRISYHDAVKKYGVDRPDLREDKNDPDLMAFCWIIDFPFFSAEGAAPAGGQRPATGGEKTKWTFTHNPFSNPKPEYIDDLLAKKNIDKIMTTQYDVVLNGFEIGGGSIRAHRPEILHKVFEVMGFTDERIEKNFGHMLKSLSLGAPPHGGIAWGLDRLVAILQGEPNIREVIAFPKTGDARDLMMDSPADLERAQLKELHLEIKKGS